MIGIEDLYRIATTMDSLMLDLNVRHKEDFRDSLLICFELSELEFRGVDEKLYERDNGTMVGYEPCDELNVSVMGINFRLTKKAAG